MESALAFPPSLPPFPSRSFNRVRCAASSGKQKHVKGVAGSAVLQQQQQPLQQGLQLQQQHGLYWSVRVGGSCAGKCGKTVETAARARVPHKAATM